MGLLQKVLLKLQMRYNESQLDDLEDERVENEVCATVETHERKPAIFCNRPYFVLVYSYNGS